MASNQATIADAAEQNDNQPRQAPLFKWQDVKAQLVTGTAMVWRVWFARAPQGLTLQDLHDYPQIWKNVQQHQHTALQKLDRVTIIAFDEAWLVPDAIVAFADQTSVQLVDIRRITMPQRQDEFMTNDGKFRIQWAGPGYGIYARAGQQWHPHLNLGYFQNLEQAKSQLFDRCYPKQNAR